LPTLDSALLRVSRLAFDTAPIIYFIEANPQYDALVTQVFDRVEDGRINGVTSVISLLEVLVVPIRNGNHALQKEYTDLLLSSANFDTREISLQIAVMAAELRSQYNLRTPDALQIANAIVNGCEAFLTNDSALKRVSDVSVLVLDELTM
jgi:predicted nucleic acid-binding protein